MSEARESWKEASVAETELGGKGVIGDKTERDNGSLSFECVEKPLEDFEKKNERCHIAVKGCWVENV